MSGTIEFVFPLVGIQNVIAEELPYSAVEPVGPGLDRGIHDTALKIAELCGGV